MWTLKGTRPFGTPIRYVGVTLVMLIEVKGFIPWEGAC